MRCPSFGNPGRELSARELRARLALGGEVEGLNRTLRQRARRISDKSKSFIDLLASKCRELVRKQKEPQREALCEEIETIEV